MQAIRSSTRPFRAAARPRLSAPLAAVFGGLILASSVVNAVSTNTDYARAGIPIERWEPFVWELSSGAATALLIPLVAWWLACFPLSRAGWRAGVPAHLLMIPAFSLAHVAGMVGAREIAYGALGLSYRFGAWWPSWRYELNKDFVTYCLIVALLVAFERCSRPSRPSSGARSGREETGPATRAAAAASGSSGSASTWNEPARPLAAEQPADREARPSASASNEPARRLVARKLNREFVLGVDEIDRIDADGNYAALHARGTVFRLRAPLSALEQQLDPRRFARVHRRHVVNLDSIREIQPWDHGDYRIVLKDGSTINLSRRYRDELRRRLG